MRAGSVVAGSDGGLQRVERRRAAGRVIDHQRVVNDVKRARAGRRKRLRHQHLGAGDG